QMHPATVNHQTILTTLSRRLHLVNMIQMSTPHRHTILPPNSIPPIRCTIPHKGGKPSASLQRPPKSTHPNVISTEAAHSLIVSSAARNLLFILPNAHETIKTNILDLI